MTVQRVSADSPTIGAGFTAGFSSAFGDTITRSTLIVVEDDETAGLVESIAGIPIAWSEG